MAAEDPAADRVDDRAGGVEGVLAHRAGTAHAQHIHVRAVGRVDQDRCPAAVEVGEDGRVEGPAEVVAQPVEVQQHTAEPQLVKRVGDLGEHRLGAVERHRGEGAEAVGVLADQVGVLAVDGAAEAGGEDRIVGGAREGPGCGQQLGADLVPVHEGQRGLRGPPGGDPVSAGQGEPVPAGSRT
jgi:hypothetical protein